MISSRRLAILVEVAHAGTVAAAAEALGYTPSALSQQLRALEQEVGAPVVERRGRRIALTQAGQVLVARGEAILEAIHAAEAEVEAIAGLRAGRLRLGWFSTAGALLVPRAIAAFRARHPGIELVLEEGDPEECARRLREGELDLAVVYEFHGDSSLPPDLRLTRLLVDRLHIALPPGHRLARRKLVRMRDLADDTWIQGVRQGPTVDTLPAAAREAGFEARIAFQTDDPLAWQGLVAVGVGVGVVPQLTLPVARPDITIRALDAPSLVRDVFAALPPGSHEDPAAVEMIACLVDAAQGLAAPGI
jgi:DNA-binding transcriptional LysR family regulator